MSARHQRRGRGGEAALTPHALQTMLSAGPRARQYLVGFSGGLDSTVLLAAMARLRDTHPDRGLRAVHVDHGLHADSAAWTAHCRRFCEALGVSFVALQAKVVPARGQSPEDAARQARYAALASTLAADEVVLLAQHRDDQAETLLYRLLRGAGSRGLAAMPAWRRFECGWIARPLLAWSRGDLLDWARSEGLDWLDDPSNEDLRYDRNFLRHQVLPSLRARFPACSATLARSADNLRDDADLLTEIAEQDLTRCLDGDRLDLGTMKTFSRLRQLNVLRHWLAQRQGYAPSRERLQQILTLFDTARVDSQPEMQLSGGRLRRYREHLYWLPEITDVPRWCRDWDGVSAVRLPGCAVALTPGELRAAGVDWSTAENLYFAPPAPGLRVRLRGDPHTRPLKKLLQQAAVPPWQRPRLAVLYGDGRPLWVAGLGALANSGDQQKNKRKQ